jgi:hypothetical protein
MVKPANSLWQEARELPALVRLLQIWRDTMSTFTKEVKMTTCLKSILKTIRNCRYQEFLKGQLYWMYDSAPGVNLAGQPNGVIYVTNLNFNRCRHAFALSRC